MNWYVIDNLLWYPHNASGDKTSIKNNVGDLFPDRSLINPNTIPPETTLTIVYHISGAVLRSLLDTLLELKTVESSR